MGFQGFRKIKIRTNDKLYSQIIRFGKDRCERCGFVRPLQCAHIMSRGSESTRFLLEPIRNGVALCSTCHDWFDRNKIKAVLFEEAKRVFQDYEEGYTFLVKRLGYTWDQLVQLYVMAQRPVTGLPKTLREKHIRIELTQKLKELENGQG